MVVLLRQLRVLQLLMRNNGITAFEGTATIASPTEVKVSMNDGSDQVIQTENIVIATGARSRNIPDVSVDGEKVITYSEAILASELPQSVIIIGGGPIGVEFAYVWANYGVQVILIKRSKGNDQNGTIISSADYLLEHADVLLLAGKGHESKRLRDL